jgi:DNA polymerase III subunit gamma/tau
LLSRLAELTRAAYGLDSGGPRDATQDAATKATATEIGLPNLVRLRAGLAQAHNDVRDVSIPRIWLESELIRMAGERPAEQPAPRREEPVRQQQQAPAQPEPRSEPVKVPEPEPVPEPVPVSKPDPTGDPALDQAAEIWAKTKSDWDGEVKLMAMKLANTRIARVEGDVAYVEFARQVDYDYVNDRPKAQEAVRTKWAANGGEGTRLVFVAAVSAPVRGAVVETTQVELPLRGEQLAQAAREVFGQQEP